MKAITLITAGLMGLAALLTTTTHANEETSLDEDQLDLIMHIDPQQLEQGQLDDFHIELIQQLQTSIAEGLIEDNRIQTPTYGDVSIGNILPVKNDQIVFIDILGTDADHPLTQCLIIGSTVATIYPFGYCVDDDQVHASFVVPALTSCADEKIQYLAACACGLQSPFAPPGDALVQACGAEEADHLQSRCFQLSRIAELNLDAPHCQGL